MNRRMLFWVWGLLMLSLHLAGCSFVSSQKKELAEHYNHRAFDMRYTNLDSVTFYAQKALVAAQGSGTDVSEAYNNLAMGALMKQDFNAAEHYYEQSLESSSNQLEHLISDVGMMRVCQRTASNKRFYDYYNKASRSIRRLREEIEALDFHDRGRLNIAESDFHLAASTYFYYMQQEDRAQDELMQLNLNGVAQSDSIQWIYAKYVWSAAGLRPNVNEATSILDEFDDLLQALLASRMFGAVYLEANILQTYSELMADSLWMDLIGRERRSELAFVRTAEETDSVPFIQVSHASIRKFEQYGDHYQIAGAYRSLADLLFLLGRYDEALEQLQKALDEVNIYQKEVNPSTAEKYQLMLYNESDSLAVETQMIEQHPMMIVPQWMANTRESISLTYSALGNKQASDYNRNIYLDILDRTRQDKELESRYEQLESESYFMGVLLIMVLGVVLLGTVGFVFLNRNWRRKNKAAIERLKRVAQLCNRISANLPDEDDIVEQQLRELEQEDASLLEIVKPYQDWSEQYASTLSDLEEEHSILEKEKYLHEQHISDYKRQNLDKRTCMSIVYGITPFLDRMINEVRKLKSDDSEEIRKQRYIYIRELVDRINEYNDILALWIKMKQGTLSLHIENFSLNELFETIAKGHRTFEQKDLQLIVEHTDACVKADKPLTLFIINTLAENARKYTPEGGTVTVKAEQTEEYVEISVLDTGCGLSEGDVRRILEEKVYDSSQIGLEGQDTKTHAELRKNKGFGFGLMNCKGIIDKYRKTNTVFSVCKFGIDSELGKGSRFYFRLPKGVLRFCILGMMLLQTLVSWAAVTPEQLLNEASRYADSTYYCNIDGEYEMALLYADTACIYLNKYYQTLNPDGTQIMSMRKEDGLAELEWWRNGVGTDYHIILDIRNEAAVASLATCQWALYRLNNQGYTRLYKLLAEDSSLESYCKEMQRTASNRSLAIWLIAILVLLFLLLYYMLYFRHEQIYRMNMEQALQANRKILQLNSMDDVQEILQKIYPDLNDIHPIRGLALLIDDGEKKNYSPVSTQSVLLTPLLESQLHKVAETRCPEEDAQNGTRIVPLYIELGGEVVSVGSLAFIEPTSEYTAQDELLNDLILRYLAIMIYQTLIRLTMKQNDVELAEDEKRRAIFEESQLHVQNQMLDNCLSSLKHETMYYPNRIRQMADALMNEGKLNNEQEQIDAMRELMDYYKEVFTLLSSCASRQVIGLKLNRKTIKVSSLFQQMENYLKKKNRKLDLPLSLSVIDCGQCTVLGDEHLLNFMMENLVDAAMQYEPQGEPAQLSIQAQVEGSEEIRFTFTDPRGTYTQEYLNGLFYPDLRRMQADEAGHLKGVQYLVARQIIRDHEELYNHRGCRINAQVGPEGKGYVLWFTLRIK